MVEIIIALSCLLAGLFLSPFVAHKASYLIGKSFGYCYGLLTASKLRILQPKKENDEKELTIELYKAVDKAQKLLADWIVPGSGITDEQVLDDLLSVLDNQKLCKIMRVFDGGKS